MCQYNYSYYSQCQHQEFILFETCGRAINLASQASGQARPDKTEAIEETEGATTKSVSTSVPNKKSYSAAVQTKSSTSTSTSSSSSQTSKSSSLAHQSPASLSNNVIMRQKADGQIGLRGGHVPDADAYAAMQAQIAALTHEVHQLRGQQQENVRFALSRSPAMYSQPHTPERPDSAASALQRRHERENPTKMSSSSSSDVVDAHDHLVFESFPSLTCSDGADIPSQPGMTASYAKVVRESMSRRSTKQPVQQDERCQGDSKWVVVATDATEDIDHDWSADSLPRSMRHSPMTTSRTALNNIIQGSSKSPRKAVPVEAPKLATERRIAERRKRMSLPDAWMLPNSTVPDAVTDDNPALSRTTTRKTYAQASSLTSPARKQQNAAYPPLGSLKSSPSKCTLTKTTASTAPSYASPTATSKAPSYASPTAASKHRVGPTDIERSPSPQKSKSVRMDDTAVNAAKLSDGRSSTRRVATPLFGSATSKSRSMNGKRTTATLPSSMDGAADSRDSDVSQTAHTNSVPRQSRKGKLDLAITIPDRNLDLPGLSSPSRIPVPIYASGQAICHEDHKQPSDSDDKASITSAVQNLDQDKRTQKAIDRASILEPIKRRLSAASSRSRSTSGASIAQPGQTVIPARVQEEADIDGETLHDHVSEEDTLVAEPSAVQSSAHLQNSASVRLLDSIRQNVKDSTNGHSDDSQQGRVLDRLSEPTMEPQVTSTPPNSSKHRQSLSAPMASSFRQDPAIVMCGSIEIKPASPASTIRGRKDSRSQPSSLRATAPSFVPVPVSQVFAPRTLPNNAPENVPPQMSRRNAVVAESIPRSIPDEDWSGMSVAKRAQMAQKMRDRGSTCSSSTTTTLCSAAVSNRTCSSQASPKHVPRATAEQGKPYWDWASSCHSASTSPVRFGRGPLPSMPEDDHVETGSNVERRGWDIGSAAPGWWYGWKGGDGLEITFDGHGPDAEQNPSAPVNFNDYDRGCHERDMSLAGVSRSNSSYSPGRSSRGSPKSFRQTERFARAMRYPAIPCGNFEMRSAVEHVGVPMSNQFVDGWCHGCWPQQG